MGHARKALYYGLGGILSLLLSVGCFNTPQSSSPRSQAETYDNGYYGAVGPDVVIINPLYPTDYSYCYVHLCSLSQRRVIHNTTIYNNVVRNYHYTPVAPSSNSGQQHSTNSNPSAGQQNSDTRQQPAQRQNNGSSVGAGSQRNMTSGGPGTSPQAPAKAPVITSPKSAPVSRPPASAPRSMPQAPRSAPAIRSPSGRR